MCHHHGGEEVVVGSHKKWDTVIFMHAEHIVDLVPLALQGFDMLPVFMLASKLSLLLGHSLPLGEKLEPGGFKLLRGLVCDGGLQGVVSHPYIWISHEDLLRRIMTSQTLIIVQAIVEHG